MKCVFCKKEIKGYGNNARPVKKGECCNDCNFKYVIPKRIEIAFGINMKGKIK